MFLLRRSSTAMLLLALASLPSVLPLLRAGFFQSDDGEWMIIRFSAFYQALADGQFPVRWLSRLNHEYGYPVANFLYPGFMYLGVPIHLFGFGFVDTVKILLGVSMVASGVFTFLWLSQRFGRVASFVGSLFYVYTPYHLFDLYKRGSVGEVLALFLFPFVLWAIEKKSVLFVSFGVALLVLSHNTLAILFVPIVAFYIFLRKIEKERDILTAVFLGLLISSFFWVPALFDLQYTRFFQTQVSRWQDHFATFQLIGVSTLAVLALLLVSLRNKKREHPLHLFFFVLGVGSVILSLPVSSPVWRLLPVAFVQFPFRFLSLTIVSVSFLSASIIDEQKGRNALILGVLLVLLLGVSVMPYGIPKAFFDKGDSYYATNEDTTNVQNEYMPRWVSVLPTHRPERMVELLRGSGSVEHLSVRSNEVSFTTTLNSDAVVRVHSVYFSGWQAFVDNKKTELSYTNERGLMEVAIPKGGHAVSLVFSETPIRLASDVASMVGIALTVLFAQRRVKR